MSSLALEFSDNRLVQPLRSCFDVLEGQWKETAGTFLKTSNGQNLVQFVDAQVNEGKVVYPATPFLGLTLTSLENVNVVILGQDPYHGSMQAQGLAFSVSDEVKIPPSLRNIYKELARDLGVMPPQSGSLIRWANQGVLLLNATLTVEQAKPASHAKKGWEILTDLFIEAVACKKDPVVFMLWGAYAQAKETLILNAAQHAGVKHLILKANHPSPLSATKPPVPFIGCGHFSTANAFLQAHGKPVINW